MAARPRNVSNPAFSVVFTGDNQVPEPATLTLLGTGLVCLGAMRRRRKVRRSA